MASDEKIEDEEPRPIIDKINDFAYEIDCYETSAG
uniref:Uncharacterized protein n=1 Tax=Marseillevirus LCMAC101 TaxID=2506602 RepID=A0A481YSA8_9VIRU|nr:MAG: hypothetical protein LCMAC101_02200 [Marseillevirus LCMAC101]